MPNAQVCVYLTIHITKLQLQTTFPKPLYIPHSACMHGDPGCWKFWCLHSLWPVRQQHTADHGNTPERPGPGMPFLDSDTCTEGGLFIFARVFFPVWCNPWMDDGTDGWMEKLSQSRCPLIYVIFLCICCMGLAPAQVHFVKQNALPQGQSTRLWANDKSTFFSKQRSWIRIWKSNQYKTWQCELIKF